MSKFVTSYNAVEGVFIPGTKGFVMKYLAYADDVTLTLIDSKWGLFGH